MPLAVLAEALVGHAGPGERGQRRLDGLPSEVSPIRLFRVSRRAIDPAAMSVIETQFSTSSCSNMPEMPKHIR